MPEPQEPPLGFRPYLDGFYDASINLQMAVYCRSEAQFARWEGHKDALSTPEQVAAWQRYLREAALAALGGLPPSGTSLEPEHAGTVSGDGFDVERLIFQSLPEVYVTANLYRPRTLSGRTGAVLFVCGHALDAKAYGPYQGVCQRLARNGLAVLAIDPLGQGERRSYLDAAGNEIVGASTIEHTYAGYQCWWLGRSIARYFVHDARRAVDYLASLPEVDPNKIGITGSSGGGTQSAWMMLLEPRLAAAAPGTFITSRRAYMWTGQLQDAEQHLPGGTAAGIDHEDSLIAMAPRPVLVLAAEYDYFALEGTLKTVERARRIYEVLGKPENVGIARARCTHQYHPTLARAATEFFVQHLRGGDPREVDHRDPMPFAVEELRCTRSGQVALDRPHARRVFDLNLAEYQARPSRSASAEGRTERGLDWLREVVQRHRQPLSEFFPRWLPGPRVEGMTVMHGFWRPEQEALNAGVLLRPAERDYTGLLIACFDKGTDDLEERRGWLGQRVREGQAVLALDVRGVGAVAPRAVAPGTYRMGADSTLFKLTCDLLWLDDSLAAIQVYDLLHTTAFVRGDPEINLGNRPLRLFAAGRSALATALATALDPGIERLELEGPLPDLAALVEERHYHERLGWPGPRMEILLPGLLTHLDAGDLRALLGGRLAGS